MQIRLASQFSAVRSLPHIGHARYLYLRDNFLNSFYFYRLKFRILQQLFQLVKEKTFLFRTYQKRDFQ